MENVCPPVSVCVRKETICIDPSEAAVKKHLDITIFPRAKNFFNHNNLKVH